MPQYITQILKIIHYRHVVLVLIMSMSFLSCEKNTYLPTGITEDVIVPYAIISIDQSVSATGAAIELKLPENYTEDFQIELVSTAGNKISLTTGTNNVVGNFNLRTYTASQLMDGAEYILNLTYKDNLNNQIGTSRQFTSRKTKGWTKLPHAPIPSGDYTGAALLSPLFNNQLAVYRYQDETKWDILKYIDKWESSESNLPLPRHDAVAFPLSQIGGRELVFVGFGYINDEKLPGKKAYLNDFWWVPNYYYVGQSAGIVFPLTSGIDRSIKYFLTYDKSYILKEDDATGEMWSLDVTWDRKDCKSFPEKTGKLSTFTINETGYVVNQLDSSIPHLFSYSPVEDKWVREADFPGPPRSEGIALSINGKGYFGLGIDKDGNGLRDLWAYDPIKNIWTFHSDYPGQGNRKLIAVSNKDKAYFGWGYESRPVMDSKARQLVGCTDFWEFNP